MVVVDQGNWLADVVFVIEGTANLSPYVESLKANYIIPTLEYFNGAPADDRDCGCDYNSTMYALVVFMAADCAPETAATCIAPTTNTHKFLSWLDKVMFIGGAGEAHSHIAEGLSTALQVFDDFQALRESNVASQKHCILICNSPPYPLPALESAAYSGLMAEQLASVMAERQISFSILSPRKIPTLFKLYEKAGGDLQHALSKNYAKDRRHLVLLRGYQLQERPMSPPSMENKSAAVTSSTNSVCSPPAQSQKRPATNSPPNPRESTGFKQPSTQSSYNTMDWSSSESGSNLSSQTSVQPSSQVSASPGQPSSTFGQSAIPGQQNQALPRPGVPTPPSSHLSSLNQPNPPNVTITNKAPAPSQIGSQHPDAIRPTRGHSPVTVGGPRMTWNQPAAPSPPASTPPTTSVLATQLSMAPSNVTIRHSSPQMSQQPVTLPSLASQTSSGLNPPQGIINHSSGVLRPGGPRMATASQGPAATTSTTMSAVKLPFATQNAQPQPAQQQATSIASSLPSQGLPVTMQSKLVNATSGSQMITQQLPTMTTASSTLQSQTVPGGLASMAMASGCNQQNANQQQMGAMSVPPGMVKERCPIWQGIIEFQEKAPTSTGPQPSRVSHSLACTFSSGMTNGEADVNAEKWPNRLVLQLLPKQLIASGNLLSVLKTGARHVLIHFSTETEGLQKLSKTMSSNWVGCIQFPAPCDLRIMVALYFPEKRLYMGFIPNDQETFFNAIRQVYETFRKKQRIQQITGNTISTSEAMGIPSSSSSSSNPSILMTQVNPLKIQQLQQTLEAAQAKELQYQQQQQQQQQQQLQQQQQMIERQNAIRQLQQQLQQQQQQLQQQSQRIQMQQVSQSATNPQLRHLLQQQVQQQIRQQHQLLMQQPQGIRQQLSTNMPPGGMNTSVPGQQAAPPAQQQQQQPQSWSDSGILDLLP